MLRNFQELIPETRAVSMVNFLGREIVLPLEVEDHRLVYIEGWNCQETLSLKYSSEGNVARTRPYLTTNRSSEVLMEVVTVYDLLVPMCGCECDGSESYSVTRGLDELYS